MKNKLFSLLVLLFACLPLFCQNRSKPMVDADGVYLVTEKMPEYPGGVSAMMQYLSSNIKYPVEAQKKNISGRVMVQFVIMEDGKLSRIKVIKSLDPLLDEEAMRAVREMPAWSPGMQDGKKVKTRFTIPISFNLDKADRTVPSAKLVVQSGQPVKNKTMQGVWQLCRVDSVELGYQISLLPVLKILSDGNTFMNIVVQVEMGGSMILAQGEYELPSDNVYVEKLEKSAFLSFQSGTSNEITVERLHDNLIKMTFKVPGREQLGTEYWHRVPSPDIKVMAD
ncbi:TonB family protein [Bacteroides helcogenes]|uniref:Outer membrane transport energization protein TonB n=1 Tax=Bacteroides helcogenes (strain ATCC 35417 / DSM 20613 / JCM 6297 / CCUG 15421 / P 36-108) TaxID=693979 RepID=E6SUV5_BACT6|nr:TonB family protein [Bacteroides helcogenes]ADV42391.1 outer membrane transport energization protein TonB [Bacteroides helcogenes P 36-108]MDY5237153.1 TonB family protein [Bacteroides helcogenes]